LFVEYLALFQKIAVLLYTVSGRRPLTWDNPIAINLLRGFFREGR
jgi:hypothetical protein